MESLSDLVSGGGVWLSVLNVVDGGGQGLWTRTDPVIADQFFNYYAARNPLNLVRDPDGFMSEWRPSILTDEDWMPKAELSKTEYYNDFLKPSEGTSCVMIRLARHEETASTSVINIGRGEGRGSFERGELEVLHALHPHLIRALKLSEVVAEAWLHRGAGAANARGPGTLVVDSGGKLVSADAAAEAILKRQDALSVVGNRLAVLDPIAAPKLQALIAAACAQPPAPRTGGSLALQKPDRSVPYVVSVAPYDDQGAGIFLRDVYAMVVVSDPERPSKPSPRALQDIFGLTRAEARLAVALLDGGTVKDVADRLGISANTAQVHLSRVFSKTGVSRQSTLVGLLSRLSPGFDTI